jgi:hypothetical protein
LNDPIIIIILSPPARSQNIDGEIIIMVLGH